MRRALSVLQVAGTGERVGASGVVSLLARKLKARGLDVHVVCIREAPLIEELAGYGIPASVIPVPKTIDPGGILRMRRHLDRHRYDVVHSHGQRMMLVSNIAARLAGTRAVVTSFHELSSVKATSTRRYKLIYTVEGYLARWCSDACIATSRPVFEDSLRVRKVPRAKLWEIHNAVDWDKFHVIEDAERNARYRESLGLRPDDVVIGTLGSLVPIKGHRHLIAALAQVRARVPAARLVIAGVGPLRGALERQAAEAGVSEHMILAGDVSDPNLLYNSLDVLALPSLAESTPLVVLEAIACGVPVVATAVGGVPELVRAEESGILVPPEDSAALADAIVRVLRDPELRARFTAAAREHAAAHYAPERFVDQHLELYSRLLDRGPERRARGPEGAAAQNAS